MKVALSAVAISVTLTLFTSSAMAVLPTVALDSGSPAPVSTAQSTLILAPAMPVVLTTNNTTTPTTSNQVQQRLLASVVARGADGAEVLSPITASTRLNSGNVIEYHGYIINQSPERVRNLKVTFDLPANTELTGLADLSPSRAYGSIDGKNFQYMPLKANIGGIVQEIPMSSYKAVQWDVAGLGLNEVAEVKYRVRIK